MFVYAAEGKAKVQAQRYVPMHEHVHALTATPFNPALLQSHLQELRTHRLTSLSRTIT
jgi:hypothetical protein